jgi:hypothetical protein
MRRLLAAMAMAIAIAACSHKRPVESVRLATLSLEPGMSASEVEDLLGSPDGILGSLCGNSTDPWNCVRWTYRTTTKDSLLVLFQKQDGKLLVNSWAWQ